MGYLTIDKISSYKIAFELSNYVWKIVKGWDAFSQKVLGNQFARAIDSISANIAEGFGRYSKKDKVNFYRYSYGSIQESLDWNKKAKARDLLTEEEYQHINQELSKLPKDVNSLIKYTNQKLRQ